MTFNISGGPKELASKAKLKLKPLRKHNLKERTFSIKPRLAPEFLRDLCEILEEEASKIEEGDNSRPSVLVFYLENNQRSYIKGRVLDCLSQDYPYGKEIYVRTDQIGSNHSKSCLSFKEVGVATLSYLKGTDILTFRTFKVDNVVIPFGGVYKLAERYQRKK